MTSEAAGDRAGRSAAALVLIGGSGRSGSTLLGDILGQMPGCIHVGELRFLFRQIKHGNRLCGCGKLVSECPLWCAVREEALTSVYSKAELLDLERFSFDGQRYRGWSLFRLKRQLASPAPIGHLARQYSDALSGIYGSISRQTGAKVIIDSSKIPMHVCLAARCSARQSNVVHLVRDPRAVAYSWRRGPVDQNASYGLTQTALSWLVSNLAVERLAAQATDQHSYALLRYEDFVREPYHELRRLTDTQGLDAADLPLNGRCVTLAANHTIGGNPSRFRRGPVDLVLDEEWRTRTNSFDRLLVTAITMAALRRYGYHLAVGPLRTSMN